MPTDDAPTDDAPTDDDVRQALIRAAEILDDNAAIAHVLNQVGNLTVADAAQRLMKQPLLMARDLETVVAEVAVKELAARGIQAALVPEAEIVEPPAATIADSGCCDPGALEFYTDEDQVHVLSYDAVILIEAVCLPSHADAEHEDLDWSAAQGTAPHHLSLEEHELHWDEVIDVVFSDPWLRLRVDCERFRHLKGGGAVTGGRQNYLLLAKTLQLRCGAALLGPGFHSLLAGEVRAKRRVRHELVHEDHLTALLTRLARDGDAAS